MRSVRPAEVEYGASHCELRAGGRPEHGSSRQMGGQLRTWSWSSPWAPLRHGVLLVLLYLWSCGNRAFCWADNDDNLLCLRIFKNIQINDILS